jgi:kynurenine 3-monooxygenase
VTQFVTNPLGLLATVRTTGWAFEDRAILLGDASHGVVPFHGQGMNAAFESCVELDRFLQANPDDWATAFAEFETSRKPDTDAIADMAVDNYVEMSTSVVDDRYVLKRALALEMEKRWPDKFVPRYGMVMFTTIPYAVAQSRAATQGKILDRLTEGVDELSDVCWETAALLVDQLEPLPI